MYISIHAPLRERPSQHSQHSRNNSHFNPRSLTGATGERSRRLIWQLLFQSTLPYGSDPRSKGLISSEVIFQSTLPYGSDPYTIHRPADNLHFNPRSLTGATRIKTKYFSIHLNQAFIANRLNSNPQRFYFDVRKLLVSHSSSSCEPKLNFMFHITSHRINLDYFSSCQSICK